MTTILVILIFNDPVVTGYLFAAILLIFDKNQNTLRAFSVLPVPLDWYLLSKNILLSFLATIVAFIMAFATKGLAFNFFHLFVAVFLSTFIFSNCGLFVGTKANSFNQLLLYSIPIFIISGIPFLSLFNIGDPLFYTLIPSWGGIGLLNAAFNKYPMHLLILYYFHLLLFSYLFWRLAVRASLKMQL